MLKTFLATAIFLYSAATTAAGSLANEVPWGFDFEKPVLLGVHLSCDGGSSDYKLYASNDEYDVHKYAGGRDFSAYKIVLTDKRTVYEYTFYEKKKVATTYYLQTEKDGFTVVSREEYHQLLREHAPMFFARMNGGEHDCMLVW